MFPWQAWSDEPPYTMSFVTDTTTKEKFWNVLTDEDWYISLGRTRVVGEKMKTEGADTWNTT